VPSQHRIFYGWWVVGALFIVGMLGPMGRYSITAFFPFIASELGWSRSEIGLAQSLSLWIYSLFVILAGWMIDRIGSKKTIFIGGLLCLCGWILLATIKSLWQFYLYYGCIMAITVSMTHYVPTQATVRKWFRSRSGLASGILASALSVGQVVFMPLLTWMSDSSGWRTTSLVCAVAFSIPIILLAYFIIYDTPESIGLHPDGEPVQLASDTDRNGVSSKDLAVSDVVTTSQFWLLFATYSLIGTVLNGLFAHIVMWAVDVGSTRAVAGFFVALISAPSIAAKVGGGWLGDIYGKRKVMITSSLACLLILLLAWQSIHSAHQLRFFAIIMGISYGLPMGLFAPYLGDLFGRANVGSLFGILTMGWGLIGGWGPMAWSLIVDMTGNYNIACLMSAGCYALALIALLSIKPITARIELN